MTAGVRDARPRQNQSPNAAMRPVGALASTLGRPCWGPAGGLQHPFLAVSSSASGITVADCQDHPNFPAAARCHQPLGDVDMAAPDRHPPARPWIGSIYHRGPPTGSARGLESRLVGASEMATGIMGGRHPRRRGFDARCGLFVVTASTLPVDRLMRCTRVQATHVMVS
jgi:hypothetical protein